MSLRDLLAANTDWHVERGDCRRLLCSLPSSAVDHVLTDPPRDLDGRKRRKRGPRDAACGDELEPRRPLDERTRGAVSRHLARVVRRWTLVLCQVEAVSAWRAALDRFGTRYRRTCAWIAADSPPQLFGARPAAGFDAIVCAHAHGRCEWNVGGRRSVYVAPRVRNPIHRTEKPVPLLVALLRDFTKPGDLVLDPFCGSGSTGVACLRLGRRFLGFDNNAAAIHLAQARLRAEVRGQTLAPTQRDQTTIFDLLARIAVTPDPSAVSRTLTVAPTAVPHATSLVALA